MKKESLNLVRPFVQKYKRTVLGYLLVGFLLVIPVIAVTQNHDVKFDHLDINSGLSQNHIMCILQDSQGFMWFGTRDGLNKYDGYKFTVYKNNPKDPGSISNNFISAILEDSKGVIWIATRGGGVNSFDRSGNKFTRFKNDVKNSNSVSSDLITNLSIDGADNLWICTEGGLNYFEPRKSHFERYSFNAKCVFIDKGQNVWAGGFQSGLNLFDKNTRTFKPVPCLGKDIESIRTDDIAVIIEDSNHAIWIGTVGDGLYAFDRNSHGLQHFKHDIHNTNSLPGNVVFALAENKAGELWIGTENGGMAVFSSGTGTFQNYQHDNIDNQSISNNSVYSVYKDANGNMWVGTFAGGVNFFNKNANRFVHYKHTSDNSSLNNNNILSMVEGKSGKIWIGTDGGGLNLFDPIKKTFTHYLHIEGNKNSICGNYVLSVLEDSEGNVWLGTWGDGITVFNPRQNSFTHFKNDPKDSLSLSSNNAWVIMEDRDKHIWVGAYNGGLNLYNSTNKSFTRFSDNTGNSGTKKIYSITEDRKGNMLVGTDGGGLRIFNKQTKTFTGFTHSDDRNSLSDNRVTNVYEDPEGNFWISTMAGLNFFNTKKQIFTTFTTADGLPNDLIFGLMKDASGFFWISTNRGLSRLDPRRLQFKNYGIEDGLQSYEFKMRAFCKSVSGAMYFGGINGFNEFYPDKIIPDAFEPPLVLTSFQVFNKEVPIATSTHPSLLVKDISETREITIPYKNSVFSFEFASLNYTIAEKKQYAYMLVNFDNTWNKIGTQRTDTYTNLNPGAYIFKVKGLNNEGEWSSRMIELKLTIAPPFWLTWWFKTFSAVFVISVLVIFYKLRINTIQKWGRQLEQQVEERTYQLAHSIKEEQAARREAEGARYEADEANRELERKNKEIEQFTYIASHDLQEPLRTTSSFVKLLQKQYQGKFDARADKYFAFIADASDRMKMLIKNLLDLSQVGNKKELELVDCNQVLHNVLADLEIAINETEALITYDLLPSISGYATELKQLFQNLIINAIKFRRKETRPEINISVQNKAGYWQFAFKDNGIGIEKEQHHKIFAIFQRLHSQEEYVGSGIGLSHCKKIVELHKGKIWVESTPGQGSTFYVTLPSQPDGVHKSDHYKEKIIGRNPQSL